MTDTGKGVPAAFAFGKPIAAADAPAREQDIAKTAEPAPVNDFMPPAGCTTFHVCLKARGCVPEMAGMVCPAYAPPA